MKTIQSPSIQNQGTAFFKFLSRITGSVLLWLFKGLSFLIYFVLRYIVRYRKALIRQNLSKSFPDKSAREIDKLMKVYYRHMSDLLIEPFLFYLAPKSLRRRLASYTNLELLDGFLRDNKQVIVFASHYGNWEYLVNLPEVTDYPVYTAYSPIKIAWVNRLMIGLRSFFGVTLIAKQVFYRQAVSLFRKHSLPKLLVVIGDQRPGPGNHKFYLPFLDQNTAVQTGGERIAALSGATLVYVRAQKIAQFSYEFIFTEMKNADRNTPMNITSAYYRFLEESIFHAPGYWLWSHNRWKIASPVS
ncbi:lysophospholipid acyltransferase family protein [Dyadobacter luticola]|uniref:Lipid A biosynthesis acyltransferase n=1 Tax=Dyadobacter luticola TaxID=1979387 RepID=A0A5R9KY89_9BACT|nr:lysophospholipid acyltransferase family protein [Dyadobacter luticola]TLV01276.1 lipid A biosynthesis acyltransferase [Dyadobacter luticola]